MKYFITLLLATATIHAQNNTNTSVSFPQNATLNETEVPTTFPINSTLNETEVPVTGGASSGNATVTQENTTATETPIPIDALFNTNNSSVNDTIFDNCTVDDYYNDLPADVTKWTIDDVEALVVKTHLQILPSLGDKGEENVLDALVDLDAGSTVDTVYLYMREIDFDSKQVNTPEGWKRGDLWPLLRGADLDTAAGTDVHTKRPEDWEVDTELRNLFWGTCGTVKVEDECVVPAIPEQTAPTSATDYKIKTPPEDTRGMVARSVLYTALRYRTDLGLTLSDCPPWNVTEYGYLSELLTWHKEYPVTEQEIERNTRACSRWQGNRNPFVDYPQLVSQFYGVPDTIREGTLTYSICTDPTDPPTASPNECSSLSAGDISALIINSDPVDQIVFFPVSDLSESIGSIFVTDRAWNGTDFVTDEGTIEVRKCNGTNF
jgi:endonuclease I